MGGLGNNFFQLNYAYYLRSQGYVVIINVSLLMKNNFVSKILRWSQHYSYNCLCQLDLLDNFILNKKINIFILLYASLSKYFKCFFINTKYCGLATPKPKDLQCLKVQSLHLFGYFHVDNPININFRFKINHEINNIINSNFKLLTVIDRMHSVNTVVIHVRGGDFLNNNYCSLGSTYYDNSLNEVADHRGISFCVITNDQKFAKNILNIEDFYFVDSCSALEDFAILVKSRFKILSNSTFAWWSGELSDENSTIIEPFSYYGKRSWQPISLKTRIKVKN